MLLIVGLSCLAMGFAKVAVFAAGDRVPGRVVFQERAFSSRGATWLRYEFQAADGKRYSGSAMTAAPHATQTRMVVAYLPALPQLNIPAYGPYTALLAAVWTAAGLVGWGCAYLFRRKAR
jgi:hypothetical protein